MQLEKKHTGTGTHAHLASSAYPIRMTHLHVPFACPMHVPSALPICMSHSHVPLHPICMSHPHFPFACPIRMSRCISFACPIRTSHLHVPFACPNAFPIASHACPICMSHLHVPSHPMHVAFPRQFLASSNSPLLMRSLCNGRTQKGASAGKTIMQLDHVVQPQTCGLPCCY